MCCFEGKVSGHLNLCCSSDRDVPDTQREYFYFFTNCRHSDSMSSNGSVHLADTGETCDESPSLNRDCSPNSRN